VPFLLILIHIGLKFVVIGDSAAALLLGSTAAAHAQNKKAQPKAAPEKGKDADNEDNN
jgi:hypothetical protein